MSLLNFIDAVKRRQVCACFAQSSAGIWFVDMICDYCYIAITRLDVIRLYYVMSVP